MHNYIACIILNQEMQVTHVPACGNIKAKHIIFTVGPDGRYEKDEAKQCEMLYQTIKNVLNYANDTLQAKSIAIPAISCGKLIHFIL